MYNHYHMMAVYYLGLLSLLFLSGPQWIVVLIFFCLFQGLGISVTYHRYYSHNSFKFKHEWMRKLFTLFGVLSGQSSPVSWAAVHQAHHKHADTEKDPHSPVHGITRCFLWMTWEPHDVRTVVRLMRDPFNKFLYEYTTLVILAYWFILYLLGGTWLLAAAGLAPAGLSILCSNLGNYLAHHWGYRTYETKSGDRNNWFIALIFFGEGWHNNHHHKPNEYSFQHKWWEIDPGAWIIRRIKDAD